MSDSTPSPRDAHASGSHFQPSTSVVLIIVVLFVAAAFLMVRAASPSTNPGTTIPTTASGSTTTTASGHPTIKKSQVRVQVANGTLTQGLAARVTQTLQIQGWDTLPPGNGPRVTATVVYYNPGYKTYSSEIAATLHLPATSVQPLGGLNPIAGSTGDDVIVVLGPNSAIG